MRRLTILNSHPLTEDRCATMKNDRPEHRAGDALGGGVEGAEGDLRTSDDSAHSRASGTIAWTVPAFADAILNASR